MGSYYSGKQIGAGIFNFGHKSILHLRNGTYELKKGFSFAVV
jgi:hypothetical protein